MQKDYLCNDGEFINVMIIEKVQGFKNVGYMISRSEI